MAVEIEVYGFARRQERAARELCSGVEADSHKLRGSRDGDLDGGIALRVDVYGIVGAYLAVQGVECPHEFIAHFGSVAEDMHVYGGAVAESRDGLRKSGVRVCFAQFGGYFAYVYFMVGLAGEVYAP